MNTSDESKGTPEPDYEAELLQDMAVAEVAETEAEPEAIEELPELRRRTSLEILWSLLRHPVDKTQPKPRVSLRERLRRISPRRWIRKLRRQVGILYKFRINAFRTWRESTTEVRKTLREHRRLQKERLVRLRKIRTLEILQLLEDDPAAYHKIRPTLPLRTRGRLWTYTLRAALYNRLESAQLERERKRLRKEHEDSVLRKEVITRRMIGLPKPRRKKRTVGTRMKDAWANLTRREDSGLMAKRKDLKIRLTQAQWTKLEQVYARARRFQNDGKFDEAVTAYQACVDMLGKSTGPSIYGGLAQCRREIFDRESPKRPIEWIKQNSQEVSFCFQQAYWLSPTNTRFLQAAADAKEEGERWEERHKTLAAKIEEMNYAISRLQEKRPDNKELEAARRDVFSARVSQSIWGYAEAEAVVVKCRDLIERLSV